MKIKFPQLQCLVEKTILSTSWKQNCENPVNDYFVKCWYHRRQYSQAYTYVANCIVNIQNSYKYNQRHMQPHNVRFFEVLNFPNK